jgi:hypothetical protein
MENDQHQHADEHAAGSPDRGAAPTTPRSYLKAGLNVVIVCMLAAVCYFSYAFLAKSTVPPEPEKTAAVPAKPAKVIQLDVLNGCGAKGAGVKFTSFLRANGFDVVEMKNYKTFNVAQTLVLDRVGDLSLARRVAASLGVAEKNVVQQINQDYFVDVSVIIGADYPSLRVGH